MQRSTPGGAPPAPGVPHHGPPLATGDRIAIEARRDSASSKLPVDEFRSAEA